MEALEFLREAQKMCRSNECFLHCPIHDICFFDNYDVISDDDLKTFVSAVEVWSKKHPQKTRADKFREVFGCSRPSSPPDGGETDLWWDEPYKEPEHDE